MIAAALVDCPDDEFLNRFGEMSVEERDALPDGERRRCYARYRELTPWVQQSVDHAAAAQERAARARRAEVAPIPGFHVSAIWEGYSAPPYLAKGLLAPGDMTVLFGQSGHFKSVAAIDLGLCVGAGIDFHGMRVRRGGVLYVAGEGHAGIRKRARAWLLARGLDATSDQPSMYITSAGADLIGEPARLRATVDEASARLGRDVELVVLDTLAANFGPGDEHHSRDMQLAIAGARAAAPSAAILLLHHTGHNAQDRERGSSALSASADCRLQATYDELSKSIELRWHKLKDDERPEPIVFGWKRVPLDWEDEDGEQLTSIVLERLEGPRARPAAPGIVGLGKNQDTALKSLRTLYARQRRNVEERGDDPAAVRVLIAGWRAELEARGIARNRFHEVQRDLQARALIAIDGPHVLLTELLG